jgi:hypothetical protein
MAFVASLWLTQSPLYVQSVILPMFFVSFVSNMAVLEAANASGDKFDVVPSLVVDALVNIVSCCFGNPFPATIYIGV